jgi:hypothetical protein
MKIKVNTIDQYKIMRFISANFLPDSVHIKLTSENTIKIIDVVGEAIEFSITDDGIIFNTETGDLYCRYDKY